MKKIVLLLAVFFALGQTTIMAQLTDQEPVNFNAILNSVFNLNVVTGVDQTATFTTAADYNNGVFEGAGFAPGFSTVTMEATGNWNLQISCPDFAMGTESIPINNLGVWCTATGAHQFGTEVTCAYTTAATSLGLANANQMLINLGTDPAGNGGDATDNAFTLHWRMGTMNGTMNATSMFDQMAAGDFPIGTYTTTATLTMTEIP
jgi:hypothetical protein